MLVSSHVSFCTTSWGVHNDGRHCATCAPQIGSQRSHQPSVVSKSGKRCFCLCTIDSVKEQFGRPPPRRHLTRVHLKRNLQISRLEIGGRMTRILVNIFCITQLSYTVSWTKTCICHKPAQEHRHMLTPQRCFPEAMRLDVERAVGDHKRPLQNLSQWFLGLEGGDDRPQVGHTSGNIQQLQ